MITQDASIDRIPDPNSSYPLPTEVAVVKEIRALDRDHSLPLYRQLYDVLRQQIEIGELKSGEAIPTEMELVQAYEVSRVTTRKALQLLVNDGVIVRRPGKGTFVHLEKIEEDQTLLQGFAEQMAARHPEQRMEILGFERILATQTLALTLGLEPGAPVLRIRRRHVIRQQPVAYAVIYLSWTLGQHLTEEAVSTTPIYTLLARTAGTTIKRATQRVGAIAADGQIGRMLGVPGGSPVLAVKRVTYSAQEIAAGIHRAVLPRRAPRADHGTAPRPESGR